MQQNLSNKFLLRGSALNWWTDFTRSHTALGNLMTPPPSQLAETPYMANNIQPVVVINDAPDWPLPTTNIEQIVGGNANDFAVPKVYPYSPANPDSLDPRRIPRGVPVNPDGSTPLSVAISDTSQTPSYFMISLTGGGTSGTVTLVDGATASPSSGSVEEWMEGNHDYVVIRNVTASCTGSYGTGFELYWSWNVSTASKNRSIQFFNHQLSTNQYFAYNNPPPSVGIPVKLKHDSADGSYRPYLLLAYDGEANHNTSWSFSIVLEGYPHSGPNPFAMAFQLRSP